MPIENYEAKYITTTINGISLTTFALPAKHLVSLSYVAVRGRDNEEGAVQRVLNKQRITSIRDYVLGGTMFVNTFVLNWTNEEVTPTLGQDSITIPLADASAQLIDGQHRLAGIEAAMKSRPEVGENNVFVTLAVGLNTKEAARIFLNINTEQRPAPKSLIYDLYGVTDDDKNFALTRANDIAKELNENIASPFYNLVKYPGMPRGKGRIDLSTIVSALKSYVELDGVFSRSNIRDLNMQKQILINYFNALKYYAERDGLWGNKSQNIILQASGFVGAAEFFAENVITKCVEKKSFKEDFIKSLFDYTQLNFVSYQDVKGMDGKTARKVVKDNLSKAFFADLPKEEEYEF